MRVDLMEALADLKPVFDISKDKSSQQILTSLAVLPSFSRWQQVRTTGFLKIFVPMSEKLVPYLMPSQHNSQELDLFIMLYFYSEDILK
jgi:hypothetical protein